MTKSMRTLTFLVAVGFAVPALAGQAVPRTSGGSSSSSGASSGGGSGGGSSSSGSGSGGSSSSSGSSGPTTASGSPMFGNEFKSTHSRIASGSGNRTGTAAVRHAPTPGGVASGGSSENAASSREGSGLSQGFGADPSFARTRSGQPLTGSAVARPLPVGGGGGGNFVSFPFYGPWGTWYPWYGGFGWNIGFVTYNPWYYGAARWYWGPYGLWYDPFTYWDPFYASMYLEPGYGGGGYSSGKGESKAKETTGSLRIKANPSSAKIYVDNALVGLVEEFDGLNGHLDLEGGRHTIELRADGYVTKSQEIDVKIGTTQTVRISLKRIK